MKYALLILLTLALPAAADDSQALSLALAQPLQPQKITVTGRVQAMTSARISARVSGHVREFGKDDAGRMLDAGMMVKEGQTLFSVDKTTFENAKAVAEAALGSARANLENLKAKPRPERISQLQAAIEELDVRIRDRKTDEDRFVRLGEALPARKLEEVRAEIGTLTAAKRAAQARLDELMAGPTTTELAVAEARVIETQAALNIAEKDLRDTTIVAPFAGLITKRYKSIGDYLTNMPPTEVVEIVSMDKLEVELRLPESYFTAVFAGKTQVLLRSPMLAADLQVPVTRVVGEIDPARGTFPIRLAIPADQRGQIVPGAFLTGTVSTDGNDQGVIVPIGALVQDGTKSAVFVATAGKMSRREVVVGDRLTENVIIRSGISAGEKVLVGPASAMKDGAPLPE